MECAWGVMARGGVCRVGDVASERAVGEGLSTTRVCGCAVPVRAECDRAGNVKPPFATIPHPRPAFTHTSAPAHTHTNTHTVPSTRTSPRPSHIPPNRQPHTSSHTYT